LGSELLTSPNLVPTWAVTPVYESDFSSDADTWADTSADTPTISFNQTVGGKDACLKVTDAGGSDLVQIGRAATRVAATFYKITMDVFCETGSTLGAAGFMGAGKATACTTNALTRNSGNNVVLGADNAWKSITIYTDAGANTALDLTVFTAADGSTGDELAGAKFIAFKDIKIYAMTNQAAWTHGTANDDFLWDFANEEADKVVNNTTALTSNDVVDVFENDMYRSSYVHTRSATGVTTTFGGTTLDTTPSAGTFTEIFGITTDGTSNLVFTADATLVGTIDTTSLKKLEGVNLGTYFLKDSIRSGTTLPYVRKFETKQPYSTEGWMLYATTGGSACIMDMTMTYEVM
jgi:hypothetical protein